MRRKLVYGSIYGVALGLLLLAAVSFFGSRLAVRQTKQTPGPTDAGYLQAVDAEAIETAGVPAAKVVAAATVLPARDQTMSQPIPIATKEPPFNYTRGDLDAAQAKWLSHSPIEYEEVVTYSAFSLFSGTWKLHVKVNEGVAHVVGYERDESQGGKRGGAVTANDLEFLTIENMFLRLDQAISGSQPGEARGPGAGSFPLYYKSIFDPALGYPTLFESDDNSDPPMVADVGFRIQVQSVKILSTAVPASTPGAVPGMPRTGRP